MENAKRSVDARFGVAGEQRAPERLPTAIFIAHGMGQQTPFDTLTAIACGLGGGEARGTAREIYVDHTPIERLEMDIGGHEVHLYEAYWAPLTEGVVGIRDVLRFLFSGAANGIGSAIRGWFKRYINGKIEEFPIPASTVAYLLSAVLVICSLIVMNTAIAAVVTMRFSFAAPTWLNDTMLWDLQRLFEVVLLSLAPGGLLIFLSMKAKRARRALIAPITIFLIVAGIVIVVAGLVGVPVIVAHDRASQPTLLLPYALLDTVMLLIIGVVAAIALIFGAIKIVKFFRNADKTWWLAALVMLFCLALAGALVVGLIAAPPLQIGTTSLAVFALLALVSAFIRWFLIEYIGDVAVYVQPHKVDRFFDLRNKIKDLVYQRMKLVYKLDYRRVFVVAHSLRSVIVYDALNRLINDDLYDNAHCDVVERTPLLLTFGSPLDKTAFIFHINSTPRDVHAKEALATTKQPILEGHRPKEWINIWSPQDILGGKLDFYDLRCCENKPDSDASTPLVAHTQFWDNHLLYDHIRRRL
jgi:hypothetical protein